MTEDAIVVFLLMTFMSIGYSYFYDLYFGYGYFSIESIFSQYFKLIIIAIGVVVGIRLVGGHYGINNMPYTKIFIIYILASGFITFLSNFGFLIIEYYYPLGFFGYYFLKLVFNILIAIYLVMAFLPNKDLSFKDRELVKNLPVVFFFTAVLYIVNMIYGYAYEFIYSFSYLLNF